jgi:hypothetical protein
MTATYKQYSWYNLIDYSGLSNKYTKLKNLKKERDQNKGEIKSIESDESNKVKKQDTSLLDKVNVFSSPELNDNAKQNIALKTKRIEDIDKEMKMIDDDIDANTKWFEGFNLKPKLDAALANMKTYLDELFDTLITMAILFLFKNVVFPILFIWGLSKLVDRTFNTNFENKLQKIANEKIVK